MDHNLEYLEQNGIIQRGHFVLHSNTHTDTYINFMVPVIRCDTIFENLVLQLKGVVNRVWDEKDVIIVSTGKASYFGHAVARELSIRGRRKATFIEARRGQRILELPFGQDAILRGKRLIFMDDVISTGKTLSEIETLAQMHGAKVACCVAIVYRGPDQPLRKVDLSLFDIPVHVLCSIPRMNLWDSRSICPLCRDGVPFSTTYGKGAEEFAMHGQPLRGA